jgi:hypothetical protein
MAEKGGILRALILALCWTQTDMAPTYEQVTQELGWPVDPERLATMKAANAKALSELEDRIKDAEENLGDVEVRDAWAAKAEYLCKIGEPPSSTNPLSRKLGMRPVLLVCKLQRSLPGCAVL